MRIPRLFTFPQMVVATGVGLVAGLYIYKPLLEKQIIDAANAKEEQKSPSGNMQVVTDGNEVKQS